MVKYIETPVYDNLADIFGTTPDTTPSRMLRYTWESDGEFRGRILDNGVEIANYKTTSCSGHGLKIIDALDSCEADGRVQVTAHSTNRTSVQVFDGDRLVLDLVTFSDL